MRAYKMLAVFLCFVVLMFVAIRGIAQSPDKTVLVQERQNLANESGEKWAVIIGIDKWDNEGVGQLKYTVNDAKTLAQTLTTIKNGFPASNVRLLTSDATSKRSIPTRSNILAMLRGWFSLAQPEDTILFYFSGHGMERNGKTYLLPQDVSLTDLENTSIELNYIKQVMKKSQAKTRILMFDACHSGAEKGGELMSKAFAVELAALENVEGMITLASCDLNEQSYEMENQPHGAFTYFLIEALKGAADRDNNGQLWASEVNYYVWDKVRRWAASRGLKQTPKKVVASKGEIVLAEVGTETTSTVSTLTVLAPQVSDGITFELKKCERTSKGITCHLLLTSNKKDTPGFGLWCANVNYSLLYDQSGNVYRGKRVRIANAEGKVDKHNLIADLPTKASIYFENMPSSIKQIKRLSVRYFIVNKASTDVHFNDVSLSN